MKLFKFILFFLIQSTLVFSKDGNGAGGGTDTMKMTRAWFLGPERTITSCLKDHPLFGQNSDFLKKEILSAYSTWGSYIRQKNIKWDLGNIPAPTAHIDVRSECKGDEDLVFYFGAEDDQVKRAKKHYLNPYGIAEQVSYDASLGWSKGFIWIALPNTVTKNVPDWTLPNTLKGILLHEIGHTLGNSHINGTIMEEDFGSVIQLQNIAGEENYLLTQIDHYRELYLCRECSAQFFANDLVIGDYLKEAVKKLTGQVPVGSVKASYKMAILNEKPQGEIEYQLQDGKRYVFQVKTISEVSLAHGGGITFQAEKSNNQSWTVAVKGTWGYSFYGTLTDGKRNWPIILNRNIRGRCDIVEAETGTPLFTSFGYEAR